MDRAKAIDALKATYKAYRLTLYLGAGISVGSGLPTWDQLVLAMYFAATEQEGRKWRAFPNYLFAIAQWHLDRSHEPPDITARKLRNQYLSPADFLDALRKTLFAGFTSPDTDVIKPLRPDRLLNGNPTLQAVASLCNPAQSDKGGVRAVITYNYDDLLEQVLKTGSCTAIWNSDQLREWGRIPIYHVHGYIPIDEAKTGSTPEQLIFTEDQYHLAAQDAYSWANIVQLKYLTSTTGLMVGVSLTDRSMRRLLDAVQRTPLRSPHFAILQRPQWQQPSDKDLMQIHIQAQDNLNKYRGSGIKAPDRRFNEIKEIIGRIEKLDLQRQTSLLEHLGICPIWYDDHDEVPELLNSIIA